ncbi:MAG: ABC transporter permease [Chromatiaceae bacterium]|nr:ABC transporter permease [Chromatiaceae bacterium]
MRSRLVVLLVRDLRAQYAGSAIGVGWNLLRPFLQISAYYFAFGIVLGMRHGGDVNASYPHYLLSGLVPWLCFIEGANRGTNSLVSAATLIKKTRLPLELLTAKAVLAPLVTYGPFVILLWAFNAAWIDPASLLPLLLWLVAQVLFTFYLAHSLAILTSVVRDIGHVFNVLLGMLIFLAPVLYSMVDVPERFRALMFINPMTPFVVGYHSLVLHGELPQYAFVLTVLIWLAVAAAFAAFLHRRARGILVDWL